MIAMNIFKNVRILATLIFPKVCPGIYYRILYTEKQQFLSTAFISPIRNIVPQKQNVKYILSEPPPTHLFVKTVLL